MAPVFQEGARHLLETLGDHDVAPRTSGPDRFEAPARDERQHVGAFVAEERGVALVNDAGPRDAVLRAPAARRLDLERVAGAEVAQEPEVRVAMSGEHDVAGRAGRRAPREVAGPEGKRLAGRGRHDDGARFEADADADAERISGSRGGSRSDN